MKPEFDGTDKRTGDDRRARKTIEVSIGGFGNGAEKQVVSTSRWLKGGVISLLLGIVSVASWVALVGFTDARQSTDIEANVHAIDSVAVQSQIGDRDNELALRIVSTSLAETVSEFAANQAAIQAQIAANRRDIDRLRDGRE